MGNNDHVIAQVEAASAATAENVWHLPLPDAYRKTLDSVVADMRNIGTTPYGGALTAGLFLEAFVDDVPWAHLDIGVAAMSEADKGIVRKGGTGFGVRLLAETCASWSPSDR